MATIGHGSRTMKRFAKYLLAGVIIQIVNILFYSAIVYLTASLWRTVGARLGKLT